MKLGKKKIKKNVNIILTLFVFCIAFLETVFYYQDEITNIVYLLLLSIFNGVIIFGMNSSIDIFDIINVQSNDLGIFRRVLDIIYIYCYFGAPIITINYVSRLINYLAKGKLSLASLRKCERIVIVGYN